MQQRKEYIVHYHLAAGSSSICPNVVACCGVSVVVIKVENCLLKAWLTAWLTAWQTACYLLG